jgi:hypothetical protein
MTMNFALGVVEFTEELTPARWVAKDAVRIAGSRAWERRA